ncbi:MAG: HvfC/BufC N-terminal domain-containing protein [Thermoanaerobaculia bacterium]
MTLRALQEQMLTAILGPAVEDERLAIYWRAYRIRLVDTLHAMFPRLRRALGEPLFDDFALEFIHKNPPRGWTLERLAETFPQWLAETSPSEDWAVRIVDLARREGAFRRGRYTFASNSVECGDGESPLSYRRALSARI